MRNTISGLVAAIAVIAAGTVPASACGFQSECGQVYVPAPVYSGCNSCGGWTHERLPDPEQQYGYYGAPVHQYYYADQGPSYTGPGDYAPYPTYREGAVSGWGYRHHHYHYGYHTGYHGWSHSGMRYGYPMHRGYAHEFYAPHHNMRYGYHAGMSHQYGYREHMMHRHF